MALALAGQSTALSRANPSLNYRFGFGMALQPVESYDLVQVAQLRAGAYLSWWAAAGPTRPIGMEYIQVIRVHQQKTGLDYDAPYTVPYTYTARPAWEEIKAGAEMGPGSLWLIGNEPDRVDWPGGRQDECLPEVYAEIYHDAYTRIKGWDPTAQVAIGGVCQVTPLRLEYLDRVLEAYRARYGTRMPVDVWNVHAFVLRERRLYEGCPDCWGIGVPAGSSAAAGVLYDIRDTDSLAAFQQQVVTFRRWMRDHGERDKPLIVSEYGVLMPYWVEDEDGRTFTPERVRDFMYGSFDYLQNATDLELGYPADKNRLVQRWIWYSLDADPEIFGGGLFDPTTRQMSALGRYWIAYVNDPARMPAPHVNLFPVRAWATQSDLVQAPSDADATHPVTITLRALIGNSGSLPLAQGFAVRFEDEGGQSLGEATVSGLRCCGGSTTVSVLWPNAPPGEHRVWVRVDPAGHIAESDPTDNGLTLTVSAGPKPDGVTGSATATASAAATVKPPTPSHTAVLPSPTATPMPVSPTPAGPTASPLPAATGETSTLIPEPSTVPAGDDAMWCLGSGLALLALLACSLVRYR